MKKMLLITFALLLVANVANAGKLVGLYADLAHTKIETYAYPSFTCYPFFINQDGEGLKGCEYTIALPGYDPEAMYNDWEVYETWPTTVALHPGSATSGVSVVFKECYDNVYVYSERLTIMWNVEAYSFFVGIEGFPTSGLLMASCELGYPLYDLCITNHLAVNCPGVIDAEESSWGAIKSLF